MKLPVSRHSSLGLHTIPSPDVNSICSGIRRRSVAVAVLALVSQPPREAWAAIPSISEYGAVQYKMPVAPAPQAERLPATPATGLRDVQAQLESLEPMVANQRDFEGVRALLRRPLFSEFLGYTPGVRGYAGSLRPAAALVQASTSAEPLQELLLDLKRLDDFCLANRVIVFNDEDLSQIKALMAAPTQRPEDRFDLEEARGLIADAQEHVVGALAALR